MKYKVQSTKYKVQSTKYKVQSTKYKVQSTKRIGRKFEIKLNRRIVLFKKKRTVRFSLLTVDLCSYCILRTFTAFCPFLPSITSNSTLSFSRIFSIRPL